MKQDVKYGGEPLLSRIYNEKDDAQDFLAQCAQEFSDEVRKRRPGLAQGQEPCSYTESLVPCCELGDMLEHSFLPGNIREDISGALQQTQASLPALCAQPPAGGFPVFSFDRDAILQYLNSYYSLLYLLLHSYEGLKQWKDGQEFLRRVLCFGCDFSYSIQEQEDGRGVIGVMTPLSPCYLSALLELAQEKCYYQGWRGQINPKRADICKEILRAYTRRYMNWCITVPQKQDGLLCRARLRMYTESPLEQTLISLPIIPLEKTSSYEGVSELRLFEKIKYELERKPKAGPDTAQPFRVALLGEIDPEMFANFCQLLDGWLKDGNGRIEWADKDTLRLQFIIATKNPFRSTGLLDSFLDMRIGYECADYENLLSDSKAFSGLVGRSNLILLLDCCDLYEPVRLSPYPGLNSFLQRVAGSSYETGMKDPGSPETALASGNTFSRMYSLLTGAAYGDGTPAFLEKVARKQLLHYLEGTLKQPLADGAAYVYLSDLNAAGELYWQDAHFLRVEEYVCKQIAILQFGGRAEDELDNARSAADRVLVFNLWQFIKHTALHRLDDIMKFFEFKATEYYKNIFRLSETQIGIDYSDWSKSLRFYYDTKNVSHPGFELKLEEYLTSVIIPCFTDSTENLYAYYLRKCTAAFLYSDTKNVDDMLFLYLYERQHTKLRYDGAPPDKRSLQDLVCRNTKYSGKRFYQEVIADYDSPSQFFANQYRKLEIMEKSGKLKANDVFKRVGIACEGNGYTDSYLYQNCLENLK